MSRNSAEWNIPSMSRRDSPEIGSNRVRKWSTLRSIQSPSSHMESTVPLLEATAVDISRSSGRA